MAELRAFYHILSEEDWEMALSQGEYRAPTLVREGFMHCSYSEQLAGTAGRYYPTSEGYVVLTIDAERVTTEVRVEVAKNGDFFPHIYGPLNLDAVTGLRSLEEALRQGS